MKILSILILLIGAMNQEIYFPKTLGCQTDDCKILVATGLDESRINKFQVVFTASVYQTFSIKYTGKPELLVFFGPQDVTINSITLQTTSPGCQYFGMNPKTIVEHFYADFMQDFTVVRSDVQLNLLDSFLVYYLKVTGDVTTKTTIVPPTNPSPSVSSFAKPEPKNPLGFCTDINTCFTATCKTVKDCTKLIKIATTKSILVTLNSQQMTYVQFKSTVISKLSTSYKYRLDFNFTTKATKYPSLVIGSKIGSVYTDKWVTTKTTQQKTSVTIALKDLKTILIGLVYNDTKVKSIKLIVGIKEEKIGPKPDTQELCPATSLGFNLWKSKLNCDLKCIKILRNIRYRFVFEDDCGYVCITLIKANVQPYTFSVQSYQENTPQQPFGLFIGGKDSGNWYNSTITKDLTLDGLFNGRYILQVKGAFDVMVYTNYKLVDDVSSNTLKKSLVCSDQPPKKTSTSKYVQCTKLEGCFGQNCYNPCPDCQCKTLLTRLSEVKKEITLESNKMQFYGISESVVRTLVKSNPYFIITVKNTHNQNNQYSTVRVNLLLQNQSQEPLADFQSAWYKKYLTLDEMRVMVIGLIYENAAFPYVDVTLEFGSE